MKKYDAILEAADNFPLCDVGDTYDWTPAQVLDAAEKLQAIGEHVEEWLEELRGVNA